MTQSQFDYFNKMVEIVYLRGRGATVAGIAEVVGMKRSAVSMALIRAESDSKVIEAVESRERRKREKEEREWSCL